MEKKLNKTLTNCRQTEKFNAKWKAKHVVSEVKALLLISPRIFNKPCTLALKLLRMNWGWHMWVSLPWPNTSRVEQTYLLVSCVVDLLHTFKKIQGFHCSISLWQLSTVEMVTPLLRVWKDQRLFATCYRSKFREILTTTKTKIQPRSNWTGPTTCSKVKITRSKFNSWLNWQEIGWNAIGKKITIPFAISSNFSRTTSTKNDKIHPEPLQRNVHILCFVVLH